MVCVRERERERERERVIDKKTSLGRVYVQRKKKFSKKKIDGKYIYLIKRKKIRFKN